MKLNEFSIYQRNKLINKFSKFNFNDYVTLIIQAEKIKEVIKGYENEQINKSLDLILEYLSQCNIELYIKLIDKILSRGNKAGIIPHKSLETTLFLNKIYTDQIFRILNNKKYDEKYAWLLLFFTNLSEDFVNKKYLTHYYHFINNRFFNYYCFLNYEFIKKYESVDRDVF
ncbi:MAG: hypothetical protein IPM38_05715 [Ignavibacteria bacterium]|nr:hypothetical protein [Ignavibacteria bacterium]